VLPDHEPPKDIAKIQQEMLGPNVLDSRRYPRITVTSRQSMAKPVGPRVFDVRLGCDLELHGVVRPISVPLRVAITDDRIEARGTTTIRQTDFGIQPVTAAGGTIKVKNEVAIRFTFVGRAEQG
jgi:polyisoprenoid-binding protein YceI